MPDPTANERDRVEELADAFMASYRVGRLPGVDEYVEQYPELADELRDLLKALLILEENVPPAAWVKPSAGEQPPRQIGDFLIVREIGRGGMGVVYEAIQQSLGRHVALKMLSSPGKLSPSNLERFRREAQAAARLQHSHIVPVFGFGEHDGSHYYAMQYVAGQSLDCVIESLRETKSENSRTAELQNSRAVELQSGRQSESSRAVEQQSGREGEQQIGGDTPTVLPLRRSSAFSHVDTRAYALSDTEFSTSAGRRQFYRNVARVGLQVVEALAYAHAEGILHRDIKPSNLLLDAKGNVWVTDFGLAKTEGANELTHSGDFVGTLRYMAPERLEGWSDRGSDLYSVGVTIYELLTLRAFFANTSRVELMRHIVDDLPPAPRTLDPEIPMDLETIVLKAVAKEPAARYHRAEQMAEDLRRFLADRPILARRSTVVERAGRWCRRNPVVATLAGAVVALLVVAVVTLTFSNAQIRREAAAKAAALKEREAALIDKDQALAKVWLYRGLYSSGDQDETLQNFDKAVALAPNDPEILWLRGFTLAGWGRWDEALANMTTARRLLGQSKLVDSATRDWFISMAHLAEGDRAAYQAACQAALNRIPAEPSPAARGTLLWMCTVTPDAVGDPARLAECADAVLSENDDAPTADQLLAAGAALYRAGKLPAARRRLEQALAQINAGERTFDPVSEIYAHLYLAMTYLQLGMHEEANAWLADAERLEREPNPGCWIAPLQHQLLAHEARIVFAGARKERGESKQPTPPPTRAK